MLNSIDICNRALIRLGADYISSFTDATAEAEVARALYASVRDHLLSSYPWSFATTQKTLAKLATPPIADYQYSYHLPNDFLRALSVGTIGSQKSLGEYYKIRGRQLQTNSPSCLLSYIYRPEEGALPAFFLETLIAKLAAEFCLPLTESTSRTEFLIKRAEESLKSARLTDAQQQSPYQFEDYTLIEVR